MTIDHPEVLIICMTLLLSMILGTSFYALKYWGREPKEEEKLLRK